MGQLADQCRLLFMAKWFEAIGTFLVAVAAIWGDWIRAKLFRPDLFVELLDPEGELITQVPVQRPGPSVQARYYHLRLSNRKFARASEAQVSIVRIEQEGPNRQPQTVYTVVLPLEWQNRALDPRPWRTVGSRPHAADLLCARPDGIYLTPMITPNNFPGFYPSGNHVLFWVTVQALAIEAASRPLRLEIAWDGVWELGTAEMARHLIISAS
jgi:hypothetical protein